MDEKTAAFLEEYRALCERHGFYVAACGCCDSPFLKEAGKDLFKKRTAAEDIAKHVEHLAEQEATFSPPPSVIIRRDSP